MLLFLQMTCIILHFYILHLINLFLDFVNISRHVNQISWDHLARVEAIRSETSKILPINCCLTPLLPKVTQCQH